MTSYEFAICLHVLTAILGVGQISAVLVLARAPSGETPVAPEIWNALKRLTLGTSWSLLVMLVSGAFLDFASGRIHDRQWWFRISFFLLLAMGATLGTIRRSIKRHGTVADAQVLSSVRLRAWIVWGLTAVIAALMQLKPF
jgi:hypothetical protein